MQWPFSFKKSTESPVISQDLSGVSVNVHAALPSRNFVPHVACIPLALLTCLPCRPFFQKKVLSSDVPKLEGLVDAVTDAVTEAVNHAVTEAVTDAVTDAVTQVAAVTDAVTEAVTNGLPVVDVKPAPLGLLATVLSDTEKAFEALKEPLSNVKPLQVQKTQASSEESQKTQ